MHISILIWLHAYIYLYQDKKSLTKMLINFIIPVNFDGFHDDESGIYQYTWAVGKSVCSHDVVNFSDPHEFLHSAKHWTHNGYEKNLHLAVTICIFPFKD